MNNTNSKEGTQARLREPAPRRV